MDKASLDDVIRIFGEPEKYLWSNNTFTKDNLPSTYIAWYSDSFKVVMSNGMIDELRFERPGIGYVYGGKLQIDSSLEEALEVVGQATRTVEGRPNQYLEGVLYKDINGRNGFCYYKPADRNVRFFFSNYRISALYVTRGK